MKDIKFAEQYDRDIGDDKVTAENKLRRLATKGETEEFAYKQFNRKI